MSSFPEFEELRSLIDSLCEERIAPAELRRLEELVLGHPEAEAYYVQSMSLFAELTQRLSVSRELTERVLRQRVSGSAGSPAGVSATKDHSRLSVRRVFTATAAIVGVAAVVLAVLAPWRPAERRLERVAEESEPLDNTVAVLVTESSAEWESTGMPTTPGSPLSPGRLRLKSGFAQIEFYSGATVVLEGPSDFEIISPMEAFCSSGKLRATVPSHAQGFAIGSPKVDLIDRGTEFGMKVDRAIGTEVHVFEGKVDLYPAGTAHTAKPQRALTTGQAVRVQRPEQASAIPSDDDSFLSAEALAGRTEAEARRRQHQWQARSEERRSDPSLVVYYNFQPADLWTRDLVNQVARKPEASDGSIVGCNWVTGRWPGKLALEFRQVSDRVRLNIPGEFETVTAALWARIDALPNKFSSLLMTDSWDDFEGHWHIDSVGTMEVGVQGPNRRNFVHYFAPQQFKQTLLGKWVHLALVYDRPGKRVIQYINGSEIANAEMTLDVPLRFGASELGNWNPTARQHHHPIRYLTGRMDEFMLYSRVLSADEIAELASEGP